MVSSALMTIGVFIGLLRLPSFAAAVLATSILLNLPSILPLYHDLDYVLASLLLASLAALLSLRYLDIVKLSSPTLYLSAVFIWLASTLPSVMFSERPDLSFDQYVGIIPYLIMIGFLLCLVSDRYGLRHLYDGVVIVSVLLGAVAIVQRVFLLEHTDLGGLGRGDLGHIAGDVDEYRPGGPVGDPNFFATYLIPGMVLSLSRGLRASPRIAKGAFLFAFAICFGAILATASRGALAAGLIAVLLVVIQQRRLKTVAAFIPLLAFAFLLKPQAYSERFGQALSSIGEILDGTAAQTGISEPAIAGRIGEMKAAYFAFSEHPYFGLGYGQFEVNFQDYVARFDVLMRNSDRGAHSLYLETAAETGVVGLLGLGFVVLLGLLNSKFLVDAASRAGETFLSQDIVAYTISVFCVLISHTLLHDAKASTMWLFIGLLFVPIELFNPRRADESYKNVLPAGE